VGYEFIPIMRKQFVVAHTVFSVKSSASLEMRVTNKLSAEFRVYTRNCFSLYLLSKMTSLRICGGIFMLRVKLYILVLRKIAVSWVDKSFI